MTRLLLRSGIAALGLLLGFAAIAGHSVGLAFAAGSVYTLGLLDLGRALKD